MTGFCSSPIQIHTFSSDVQRHALEEGQFLRLHRGSLLVMTLLVMQSYNKQRNFQEKEKKKKKSLRR